MNSVIEWLFQRTTDGATYLQVLIVGIIIIFLINYFFKSVEEIMQCLATENEEDNDGL